MGAARPGPPRWAWWALILLPPASIAARALWAGPTLGGGDLDFLFRPFWKYLGESLRHGRLPLWDPEMGTGIPFLASAQSQALYPPAMLLFAALPLELAIYAFSFGHILWAAAGTWRVGRKLGLGQNAAVAAAALVASAPLLDASLQRPNMLAAAAWLPWTWLAGRRVCDRAPGGIPALAACVGLGLLCASPEVTLLGALAVAGLAVSRTFPRQSELGTPPLRGERASVPLCALAGLAGVGLAAAALVPFAELLRQGSREADLRGLEAAWSLGRGDVARLFLPFVDAANPGTSFRDLFFGPFQGLLALVYLGAPAIFLAGTALRGARRREAWLFAVALLAILLAAQGGLLSVGLEGMHLGALAWRYPVKFLYPAPFALALLAGEGGEQLSRLGPGRLVPTLAIVGAAFLLAATLGARQLGVPLAHSLAWVGGTLGVLAAILAFVPAGSWRHWALILVCTTDAAACALRVPFVSQTAPCARILAEARARLGGGRVDGSSGTQVSGTDQGFFVHGNGPLLCLAGNVLAQYGLPSVRFYGTPWPRGCEALVSRFGTMGDALLGATLVLRDQPDPRPGLRPLPEGELAPLWAAAVPGASPRVELRPRARVVVDMESALEHDTLAEARTEVLLDREPPPPSAPGESYAGPDLASLIRDSGEQLEVATASPGERWLVLADLYDRGWTASVDGRPVPLRVAYGMVRAVRLGPGRHRVLFDYRPRSFNVGLWLSVATAAALLAGTLARYRPRLS